MNSPMRALILAPFSEPCITALRRTMCVTHESWTDTERLYDPFDLAQRICADSVSVLVVEADFVLEETLERTPELRFVGVCRSAVNHVDVDAATERGVVVVNTPARNANAVAEHTLGLMLALARKIPAAHEYARDGEWQAPTAAYTRFRGVELCGKTLGIIGLGAIGSRIAKMCAALGMSVLAHDPYASPSSVAKLVPLDKLMESADFVCVHAPSTPDTQSILDARLLSPMKPNAYIVSASDPAVFDMDALIDALQSRRIAGAAFDVFESHPISPQSPLRALDNVLLSPHIGGATEETTERHSQMMTEDILRFTQSKVPHNIVNPQVLGNQ